jgi:hypothetical protein
MLLKSPIHPAPLAWLLVSLFLPCTATLATDSQAWKRDDEKAVLRSTNRLLQLLLILLCEPAGRQLLVQITAAHCHICKAGPLYPRPLGGLFWDPVEPAILTHRVRSNVFSRPSGHEGVKSTPAALSMGPSDSIRTRTHDYHCFELSHSYSSLVF